MIVCLVVACDQPGGRPLPAYAPGEAGTVDHLYERQPEAPDGHAWGRTRVGLLTGQNEFCSTFPANFQSYLRSRDSCFVHLKDFRDALAHQIPIFIPPWSVDPEEAEAYTVLKARTESARLVTPRIWHEFKPMHGLNSCPNTNLGDVNKALDKLDGFHVAYRLVVLVDSLR